MLRGFLAAAMAALPIVALGAASPLQDLQGQWARDDGETRMRIAPCGGDLCATNVWVKDPKGDEHVGDVLVMKLKPKSTTELDGEADDKRRNATYDLTLTVAGDTMKSHGCAVIGLVCKDSSWTRTK